MTQEMLRHRPHHAHRTADTQAAFLLPHLRPGMALLDLGCGPGSITTGLAAAVAPGPTTGVDLIPQPLDGVTVVAADATDLPFPDGSFDAIYASALLQHLADPLAALREARRVARPGAVIGVVDADWGGELLHPSTPALRRSTVVAERLRAGTSPYVGRSLRDLLHQAGFVDVRASARVVHHGTTAETVAVAAQNAALFRRLAPDEEEIALAWEAWGAAPGAFLARFWCEALGFA